LTSKGIDIDTIYRESGLGTKIWYTVGCARTFEPKPQKERPYP
jgi:hypothetical protein